VTRRTTLALIFADAVDRQLREFLAELRTGSPLYALIEYHMGFDTGQAPRAAKRTRPILLLSVTQSLGGDVSAVLPVAAAVELLHNAALVFDDIQDRATLRRGRPAVWRRCGAAQALNVGVALQAAVHLAATAAAAAGLPAERALAASEELGLCTLRLAEGQYLDLSYRQGQRPSIDEYMRMCAAKTASLLASASYLGAVLAGREDRAEPARRLGYHLGMYLQIEDDLAGIWGDGAEMGKEAADLEGRHKTLPLLYAFQSPDAPPELAALEERYYGDGPLRAAEVAELRRYATELGGRAYAAEMGAFHRDLALRALEELAAGRPDLLALLDDLAISLAAPA